MPTRAETTLYPIPSKGLRQMALPGRKSEKGSLEAPGPFGPNGRRKRVDSRGVRKNNRKRRRTRMGTLNVFGDVEG